MLFFGFFYTVGREKKYETRNISSSNEALTPLDVHERINRLDGTTLAIRLQLCWDDAP